MLTPIEIVLVTNPWQKLVNRILPDDLEQTFTLQTGRKLSSDNR